MSNSNIAPFVKWAGGKRQLLPQIKKKEGFKKTKTTYVESPQCTIYGNRQGAQIK